MGLRAGRAAGRAVGRAIGWAVGRATGRAAPIAGRRRRWAGVAAALAARIPPGVYGYLLPLTTGMLDLR